MTPAGTSNELDVQNKWEENTHTHKARCICKRIIPNEEPGQRDGKEQRVGDEFDGSNVVGLGPVMATGTG